MPRHDETGGGAGGHEELYVVLSGRATFTVDGQSFDAPPGTLVLVERGERREAHAEEPGTVVLAAGAPVNEAYRIAPWEYGARAARARALGDVEAELEGEADGLLAHRAQSAWQTFPFAYTTPKDACYVRITVALSSAGTLDVDDVG